MGLTEFIANSVCYLCGSTEYSVCDGKVRDNNALEIRKCNRCNLVFLSSFDHIAEDYYEHSGMHEQNSVNLDDWLKDSAYDDERRFNAVRRLIENKMILDVGCGNGGFLRRARKVAASVAGVEPELSARKFIANSGIEVVPSTSELREHYDVITVFHVLEHIKDPRHFISLLADHLAENGKIIVEVPNADDALLSLYRNVPFSFFTYWSCHLYLFTRTTLTMLAKQAGLTVDYVKQVQRYPLSNHLFWLACGKPGGHKYWSFLDSVELHDAYEKQLAAIGACDTIFASFSKDG